MRALVPVFPGPDELFWLKPEHLSTLGETLREVSAATGVDSVLVLTDRPEVADLSAALGIPCEVLEHAPQDLDAPAPQHARACLDLTRRMDPDDAMIVNFRHPLLDRGMFAQAVRHFADCGCETLLGVSGAADHPCQFQRLFLVRRQGMVHFLDPDASAPGKALSRPFLKAWLPGEVPGEGLVRRGPRGARARFDETRLEEVRALMRSQGFPGELAGLEFEREDPLFDAFASRDPASGETALHLHGREEERPLTLEGFLVFRDGSFRAVLTDLCGPGELGRIGLGTLAKEPVALSWTLLEEVEGGCVDMSIPCSYGDGLWHSDREGSIVNTATGRKIVGRQDFPEVHEADRSLLVVSRGADASALDRLQEAAALHAWPAGATRLVLNETELRICGLMAGLAKREAS